MVETALGAFENLLQSVFQAVLVASAISAVLTLMILISLRFWSRKMTSRMMYVLWLVVIVRFVFVAGPESPTSLLNLLPKKAGQTMSSARFDHVATVQPNWTSEQQTSHVEGFGRRMASTDQINPPPISNSALYSDAAVSVRQSHILHWASRLWLIGIVCSIGLLVWHFRQIRLMLRRSSEIAPAVRLRFERMKRLAGVENATIRQSDEIDVPAVAGLFRPVVVIPSWCQSELSNRRMNTILLHELIHIRRLDSFAQILIHFAVIMHWFNPMVWVASGRAGRLREILCDQTTVGLLSKWGVPKARQDYANLLLHVVQRGPANCRSAFVGGFLKNEHEVTERISMLINPIQTSRTGNCLCLFLVSLFAAVGFTNAQSVSDVRAGQPVKESNSEASLVIREPATGSLDIASQGQNDSIHQSSQQVAIQAKIYCVNKARLRSMKPGIELEKASSKLTSACQLFDRPAAANGLAIGLVPEKLAEVLTKLEAAGVAKSLGTPELATIAGQKAVYHNGGEVPLSGATSGETGEQADSSPVSFGTTLKVTPTVKELGIRLELMFELSCPDKSLIGKGMVPGFRVRRLNTGANIPFGESFGLAVCGDGDQPNEIVVILTPSLPEQNALE